MSVATCNRNESLLISILKISSMSMQGTDFVPKSTLWQRYYLGAESTSAWRLYYRGADSTSAWRLLTGLRGRRCHGDAFESSDWRLSFRFQLLSTNGPLLIFVLTSYTEHSGKLCKWDITSDYRTLS